MFCRQYYVKVRKHILITPHLIFLERCTCCFEKNTAEVETIWSERKTRSVRSPIFLMFVLQLVLCNSKKRYVNCTTSYFSEIFLSKFLIKIIMVVETIWFESIYKSVSILISFLYVLQVGLRNSTKRYFNYIASNFFRNWYLLFCKKSAVEVETIWSKSKTRSVSFLILFTYLLQLVLCNSKKTYVN